MLYHRYIPLVYLWLYSTRVTVVKGRGVVHVTRHGSTRYGSAEEGAGLVASCSGHARPDFNRTGLEQLPRRLESARLPETRRDCGSEESSLALPKQVRGWALVGVGTRGGSLRLDQTAFFSSSAQEARDAGERAAPEVRSPVTVLLVTCYELYCPFVL